MCFYGKRIKNRKYKKTKKNGGVVPTVTDIRMEWIETKCGNCIECRKQKAREWQIRLHEEIKTQTNGKFITLTFSNESIKKISEETVIRTDKTSGKLVQYTIKNLHGYDRDNQIATKAIRLFNERWRKEYKTAIRHWTITELGHKGTENIHLHGIMWTDKSYDDIERIWKYGFIWPRKTINKKGTWIRQHTYVNNRTINYMMKYVSKIDQRNKEYKSKILCSPGIGHNYINTKAVEQNKYKGQQTEETYRTNTGHKVKLPAYWRNKIYTDDEKERLWTQKLDKEEKWIRGEKISTKNGNEDYNKALKWHRRINNELGYGGQPNENRKEHEEIRREEMYKKRIKNTKE